MKSENRIVQSATTNLFTAAEQSLGAQLLHHQCWCWGRDIHYPPGNLLIKRGFERSAVSADEQGSSAYYLELNAGEEIVLWGFGVLVSKTNLGAAFFARYNFAPALLDRATVELPLWRCTQFPPERAPQNTAEILRALRLSIVLLRFIITYENWTGEICGGVWRRNCLRAFPHALLDAIALNKGWRNLLKRCEKQIGERHKNLASGKL